MYIFIYSFNMLLLLISFLAIAYAPPPSSLALLVFFYSQEPQVQRLIHQSPLPHSLIHTAIPLFILSFWWTSAFTSFYIKWIICFLSTYPGSAFFSSIHPFPFLLPYLSSPRLPLNFSNSFHVSSWTHVFIPAGFYLCYCSFYCLSTLGQEIWMNVDNLC